MQSANNKPNAGFWGILLSFFIDLFSGFKTTPEDREAKVNLTVSKKEAAIEAENIIRDAKIEKRIDKARKAISVNQLKVGKLVYISFPEDNKKRKEIFVGYDEDFIFTNKGEYPYTRVFNWHGRPVMKKID